MLNEEIVVASDWLVVCLERMLRAVYSVSSRLSLEVAARSCALLCLESRPLRCSLWFLLRDT